MGTEITINGQRVELVISDPSRRLHRLIKDYNPVLESEIGSLFARLIAERPLKGTTKGDWWLIDLKLGYWHYKFLFGVWAIWAKLTSGPISKRDKAILQEKIRDLALLIDEAKSELSFWENADKNYFGRYERQLHIDLLQSVLDNPLGPDEVRFVRREFSSSPLEIISIDGRNDRTKEIVNVTPPPELEPDDHYGHLWRMENKVTAGQVARVAIGKWNFEVKETSEGELGIPVDDMLLDLFGGCPIKQVWKPSGDGYDSRTKTCHCWQRDICPGGDLLRAWTYPVLAQKLWRLYQRKETIHELFPRWRKMLEEK